MFAFVDEPIIEPPFGKIPTASPLAAVLNFSKSFFSNPLYPSTIP